MPLKTKTQTQERSTPPAPSHCEMDRFADGEVVSGGGTLSYSRRAEGSAPRTPHLLGKARPLWDGRVGVIDKGGATRRGTRRSSLHSMFDVRSSKFKVRISDSGFLDGRKTNAERRTPNSELRINSDHAVTPLLPFKQGACLAKGVGTLGRDLWHGESKKWSRPSHNSTARVAVHLGTGGCGRGTPLLRRRFRLHLFAKAVQKLPTMSPFPIP